MSSSDQALARILIVADEPQLAGLLSEYLQTWGYESEWMTGAGDLMSSISRDPPDLLIVDLTFQDCECLGMCRQLRAFTRLPVLVMTACAEEIDIPARLEFAAYGYICKPFNPRELVARVRAILRRTHPGPTNSAAPRLSIDSRYYLASLNGKPLGLTPIEFRLLRALAAEPGRALSRARLLDHVYANRRIVADRTLDGHIQNLRRKLHEACPEHEIIGSIYGFGYKLHV